jgi:hypothetical protein
MRFGAIIFDEESDLGPGWASVEGEPGWRIAGVGDLTKTEVVWLTNLNFQAHRALGRDEYLRQDYLPVSMAQMAKEWGHDPKYMDTAEQVSLAATLFGRIMRIACTVLWPLRNHVDPRPHAVQSKALGVDDLFSWMIAPVRSGPNIVRSPNLKNLFEAIFPPQEFPPVGMNNATAAAIQNWTRTALMPPKGSSFVQLRRPRLMHALELLQTPEPRGPWEAFKVTDLPAAPDDAIAWVKDCGIEHNQPCLSQVILESMSNEVADVFSFGGGATAGGSTRRNWVSHPEFLILSRYARFQVKSVLRGRAYVNLHKALPPNVIAFLNDPYSETSWSAGVVAEAIWMAASTYKSGEVPFRTAWMKAADRTNSFLLASSLHQAGYVVITYSKGAVVVAASDEQISDLSHDALSLGMIPPLQLTMEKPFRSNSTIPWGGDERGKMDAVLRATGQRTILWEMDGMPLLPALDRKQAVRKIMQARVPQNAPS